MRVDCIARNVIDQIGLEDYGLISDVDREEMKTRSDDLVKLVGVLRCIKDCNSGPLRPVVPMILGQKERSCDRRASSQSHAANKEVSPVTTPFLLPKYHRDN